MQETWLTHAAGSRVDRDDTNASIGHQNTHQIDQFAVLGDGSDIEHPPATATTRDLRCLVRTQ